MKNAAPDLRILLVEDEPLIVMDTARVLNEAGYRALIAAQSFDKARDAIETRDFDLALLDVNLNGESSLPLARALKEKGARLIFMSSYNYDEALFAEFGAPLLRKPYTEQALLGAVGRAADGL